jgi:hypothetical protein
MGKYVPRAALTTRLTLAREPSALVRAVLGVGTPSLPRWTIATIGTRIGQARLTCSMTDRGIKELAHALISPLSAVIVGLGKRYQLLAVLDSRGLLGPSVSSPSRKTGLGLPISVAMANSTRYTICPTRPSRAIRK